MSHGQQCQGALSFKALGFKLVYTGKDIEHGIEMYDKGGLDGESVKEYGLEESLKEGKTHKACGDTGSSNASKKSKGAAIANPFALLGADDGNDGSEQGDE